MYLFFVFASAVAAAWGSSLDTLTNPSIFAEWNVLNYTWDVTHTHNHYVETNQYIPQNCALAGIAVDKMGSVYVTVPRWRPGVPATLNKLEMDPVSKLYTLTPFPSWDIQTVGDNNSIQSCQAAYIDSNNSMWVVDTGRRNLLSPNPAAYVDGTPTLWIIDLATGANSYTYRFPADVASPSNSFLNDIVLDEVNRVAYFTDSWGSGGLITLDVTNRVSRRYAGISTANQPSYVMVIDGVNYGSTIFTTPSDGIALTEDNQALFYCAVQGNTLYRLPTSVLRNFSTSTADIDAAVETVGIKNPSDGLKYHQGILYYGDLPNSTFHALSITATSEPNIASEAATALSDPSTLRWVDSFAADPSDASKLWFTTNKLDLFITYTMDFTGASGANFRVNIESIGTDTDNGGSDKKSLSNGAIAGIAIGGFFGLVLVVGLLYFFTCRAVGPSDTAPLVASAQNKV